MVLHWHCTGFARSSPSLRSYRDIYLPHEERIVSRSISRDLEMGQNLFAINNKTTLTLREIFWVVMFAIVNIAGQQFKVSKDQTLFVHRLSGNAGDKVEFSEVLMSGNEGNISMAGAVKVQAEIVDHLKGDKVIVFKKKRRKGYQKSNGHRQSLTKIKINDIA